MKIKLFIFPILKYAEIIFIIILFVWISFFPQPIQEKYHLYTNIVLLLAFIILWIRKRNAIFNLSDFPLWIFLAAMSINVFFAQQKNTALKTYLDLAIPMFVIYYLVSADLSSGKNFNLLLKTICISSIIVSIGAVLESLFRYNPIYEHFIENPYYKRYITGFVRPMSTQFNPVVLGSYLLCSLPFNFLLFKRNKSLIRLLGSLGIILNIIVIILTLSRGVLLGLITAIMFYLFMEKKYRAIVVCFITLILLVLLCSYFHYPFNRLGKRQMMVENRGLLSDYRFTRYAMSWRIIREYPLVGLGFQHFRIRFYEYSPRSYEVPYEFMILDNMYLTFLAETGIIGATGFLIFIFSLIKRGILYLRKKGDDIKYLLLVLLSALIGLLVNMAAYELFYWVNPYMFFCIICAFIKKALENV